MIETRLDAGMFSCISWAGEKTSTGWFVGTSVGDPAWLSPAKKYLIVKRKDGYWVTFTPTGQLLDCCPNMEWADYTVKMHVGGWWVDKNPLNPEPYQARYDDSGSLVTPQG